MTSPDRFDEFYRATSRRLLQYAWATCGDAEEARDLTQEAYVRAWRQWGQLSQFEQPEAWLRLVVERLATDRWRRLGARRRAAARDLPPQPVPAPSEQTVLLVAALRRLPAQQRRAICLHYLLDQPVGQIAAEMGVPAGTVKSWLSRGRTALAGLLNVRVEENNHA